MSHEPERYTAGETARAAGLVGLAVITNALGMGVGLADRGIDRLQAKAREREAIAEALTEEEKAKKLKAKIDRARRS
ncbi:hypothetical protein ACFV4P_34400 [Kitasatospora sp. NPDC059795]|uniref:hypothetical protein n=1 Tax=Kitasatospora sp. NPDC059795 TaxID=3346949 RepID=UPI0036519D60